MTARAFAVTEAYLKFDEIRRVLNEMSPKNLTAADEAVVSGLIAKLLGASTNLQAKMVAATASQISAMSGTTLPVFMRNDPVSRLLWLAGQRDPASPCRILAKAGLGGRLRTDWQSLADALADRRLSTAPNLVENGSFAESAVQSQEPRFLYQRSGLIPAKWEWRAMPTEFGKVELVACDMEPDERALRIEGAWDTQFYQWIPVRPQALYVATALMRGKSSPGDDAALFLSFLDQSGKVAGVVRAQSMPKGLTLPWREVALADQAPKDAVWVGIGIVSSRQTSGDWLEATAIGLKSVSPGNP